MNALAFVLVSWHFRIATLGLAWLFFVIVLTGGGVCGALERSWAQRFFENSE